MISWGKIFLVFFWNTQTECKMILVNVMLLQCDTSLSLWPCRSPGSWCILHLAAAAPRLPVFWCSRWLVYWFLDFDALKAINILPSGVSSSKHQILQKDLSSVSTCCNISYSIAIDDCDSIKWMNCVVTWDSQRCMCGASQNYIYGDPWTVPKFKQLNCGLEKKIAKH